MSGMSDIYKASGELAGWIARTVGEHGADHLIEVMMYTRGDRFVVYLRCAQNHGATLRPEYFVKSTSIDLRPRPIADQSRDDYIMAASSLINDGVIDELGKIGATFQVKIGGMNRYKDVRYSTLAFNLPTENTTEGKAL